MAAIAKLKPPTDFVETVADCDFVTSSTDIESVQQCVSLTSLSYSRAERLLATYKRVLQHEEEVFRGYITDLHQDAPSDSDKTDINRNITMSVKYGGHSRKLSMSLMPGQYKQALEWHGETRQLFIRAVVDKNTTPWSVYDLKEIYPLDANQGQLF